MLGEIHNLIQFFYYKITYLLSSVPMGISGKTMGCMFAPVPVEIACYDPETVGCKYISLT